MARPRRLSSDADVDVLVGIYIRAQRRVERLLRQALASGALGTAAFRRQQILSIRRVLRALEISSPEILARAIRSSYLDGATITDAALAAEPFQTAAQGRFFGVHESAVQALAGRLDSRMALARTTIGRQVDDVFARVARAEVEVGVAGGLGRREVSAQIVDELVRLGRTGFVDKAGRRWALETYAETVARTATREAVTIGTVNRSLELGQDLVQISEHANACLICVPFQGRTYSITGATRGYPRADRLPPFHPRCRHVATPAPIFDAAGRRRPGRISAGAGE